MKMTPELQEKMNKESDPKDIALNIVAKYLPKEDKVIVANNTNAADPEIIKRLMDSVYVGMVGEMLTIYDVGSFSRLTSQAILKFLDEHDPEQAATIRQIRTQAVHDSFRNRRTGK